MILTKEDIEKAIALEHACSDFYKNNQIPETEDVVLSGQMLWDRMDQFESREAAPEIVAFKEFLHSLSNDQFRELQAVMFIGRGDYKPTEFQEACDEPGLSKNREEDVLYVMEKT